MAQVFNIEVIDPDELVLEDSLIQNRYRLAQKQLQLANQGTDLKEQIQSEQSLITAFEKLIDLIDRISTVTDADGERIPAGKLPAKAIDEIMRSMSRSVDELVDPNA